jgi:hypothetical protein
VEKGCRRKICWRYLWYSLTRDTRKIWFYFFPRGLFTQKSNIPGDTQVSSAVAHYTSEFYFLVDFF